MMTQILPLGKRKNYSIPSSLEPLAITLEISKDNNLTFSILRSGKPVEQSTLTMTEKVLLTDALALVYRNFRDTMIDNGGEL